MFSCCATPSAVTEEIKVAKNLTDDLVVAPGETIFKGACFCGQVKVECAGDPTMQIVCHCSACKAWGGGFNTGALWAPDKVKVTGKLLKTPEVARHRPAGEGDNTPPGFSKRMVCATCYGKVLNDHAESGQVIDVCAGIMEWPNGFKPTLHARYAKHVFEIPDGVPKFKDAPTDMGGNGELMKDTDPGLALPKPGSQKKYSGQCYCGAVTMECEGEPALLACCHCSACRAFSGNALPHTTSFPRDKVKITGPVMNVEVGFRGGYSEPVKGGMLDADFKMPKGISVRQVCSRCFGSIANDHPGLGMTSFESALMEYAFSPAIHINYKGAPYPLKDGKPKFIDYPKDFGGSDKTMAE